MRSKRQTNEVMFYKVRCMLNDGKSKEEIMHALDIGKNRIECISKFKTYEEYKAGRAKVYDEQRGPNNDITHGKKTARHENVAECEQGLIFLDSDALIPGQMQMDLPKQDEQKQEYGEQTKMMRFQAAQVEKILSKLEKINDNLCQLLRRTDK